MLTGSTRICAHWKIAVAITPNQAESSRITPNYAESMPNFLMIKPNTNTVSTNFKPNTNRRLALLQSIGFALTLVTFLFTPTRAHADEPIKVVYHVVDGTDQAARALANVRNHLRATPDVKIVVVGLGEGIRFLLKDAVDRNGKLFEPAIVDLTQQGVDFRICMNTLAAHDVPISRVIAAAKPVPSGVAEVARLQAREGFVYLRP